MQHFAVPATDAAVDQLDWAIRLLLDHQAPLPAITLAGAARGILETKLCQANKATDTGFERLKAALEAQNFGTRDQVGRMINGPRNFLKHADVSAFDQNAADLQSMAVYEIILCIQNLVSLDSTISSETPKFLKWVRTLDIGRVL